MNNGRKNGKTENHDNTSNHDNAQKCDNHVIHDKTDSDAIWFQENMMGKLEQFDDAHAPEPPALSKLEALVAAHKRNHQKAVWSELLLFWLVAVCILLGMVWMADANPVLFWGLYGIVGAACLLFFGYRFVGRAKV